MNKFNRSLIRQKVLEIAPRLQELLPPNPHHPKGRIAIAHCYHVMKTLFGQKIEFVSDNRLQDALDIIQFCADNPLEPHICTQIRHLYPPEPEQPKSHNLEEFLH